MSMRISSVGLLALGLSACGGGPQSVAPEGERIECAIGGVEFASDCILEKVAADQFAVHDSAGGFRRFSYDATTGMLTITDGAEGVAIQPGAQEGMAEFAIGPDRYRIPMSLLASERR